eukprot:scaffold241042_cov24-Tisochrysis_lutea.AAC.1
MQLLKTSAPDDTSGPAQSQVLHVYLTQQKLHCPVFGPGLCVQVGLPNAAQRVAILHSYLTRHNSELGGKAVDPELLSTSSGVYTCSAHKMRVGDTMRREAGQWALSSHSIRCYEVQQDSSFPVQPLAAGSPSKSIETIGARTEGFSGSDLMELCSQ